MTILRRYKTGERELRVETIPATERITSINELDSEGRARATKRRGLINISDDDHLPLRHVSPIWHHRLKGVRISMETIDELLIEELKDLYSAEKQITKALPKLAKAAASQDLRQAFESHLEETQGQIERLDEIFERLGKSPRGKMCHGMQGLLEEGSEILDEAEKGPARDAALICAAQKVEHYEIAGYGSVREYAKLVGQKEIASLLNETLEEEKAADEKLNNVAKKINSQASRSPKAA